jgi:hypothetical protein
MQQFATELFEHVTVTYIVLFLAYFSLLLSWPRFYGWKNAIESINPRRAPTTFSIGR